MTKRLVHGVAAGFVLIAAAAGCARHTTGADPSATTRTEPPEAPLAGLWQGMVWETPGGKYQGARRVSVLLTNEGTWTATSAGVPCAAGTVVVRDERVVLAGEPTGASRCIPHSLQARDGRMWAVFEASFGQRSAPAVIDLQRRG
jgi:hypothetical protein